jgi:hypothetical protein
MLDNNVSRIFKTGKIKLIQGMHRETIISNKKLINAIIAPPIVGFDLREVVLNTQDIERW